MLTIQVRRRPASVTLAGRPPRGMLVTMKETELALRAVLLGASNLRVSLPWVLDRVRRRAGGPGRAIEALAA